MAKRRNYKRDSNGRFARVAGSARKKRDAYRGKRAKRRGVKYDRLVQRETQQWHRGRLAEANYGFGNIKAEYHQGRSMRAGAKRIKLSDRNRAHGFNTSGERIGPAIGMRGVRRLKKKAKAQRAAQKYRKHYRKAYG